MLDKIINKHIDKQEVIENRAEKDIDTLLSALDINAILADPLEALLAVVEELKSLVIEDYAIEAVKNGKEFSDIVTKLKKSGKDIVIEDSDDPNLNKDLNNDKS